VNEVVNPDLAASLMVFEVYVMIFHPVVVESTVVVGVAAAPHVWSLAVRFWNWLKKFFSTKAEKPAVPWRLVASMRRVFPNGGSFEFGLSWQNGGAPPQTPAAPAVSQPVNQFGPPASSAPSLQLDLCSNSDSVPPVPASLPLIVGN